MQLDMLQRTVATTPSQEDQKQLSLLQFGDQNATQKQSLTDAVTNAQRGVQSANKGVADAQKGIATAELGIQDATVKVADAQQQVSDAIKKRKLVHDAAAAAIGSDERKVGEAIDSVVTELKKAADAQTINGTQLQNYLTLLGKVSDTADPGGPLSKNLDSLVGKMQLSAVLAQAQINLEGAGILGPQGPQGAVKAASGTPGSLGPANPFGVVPGHAAGGDIEANKLALVGERGPELFVPKTSGTVIPNGALKLFAPAPAVSHSDNSVTFANSYSINAQGTPTKAELEYIAREQAWQLTRSGRR